MKITHEWLVGVTEAEGNFYIQIVVLDDGTMNVNFTYSITQNDPELLLAAESLLLQNKSPKDYSGKGATPITTNSGTQYLKITQHDALFQLVETTFKKTPLLGTKFIDCELFFSALRFYTDLSIPRPVRIMYVAHCMFKMNTQGEQRKHELSYYEDALKNLFNTEAEWLAAIETSKLAVEKVLQTPFPPLSTYSGTAFTDYFCGLFTGDGCFHSDFNMRSGRKATVYKGISISLLATDRNLALLNYIAGCFNVAWIHRKAKGRHNPNIGRQDLINNIFKPYFDKNKERFPLFRQKELDCWNTVDRLGVLLKKPGIRSEEDKEQLSHQLGERVLVRYERR